MPAGRRQKTRFLKVLFCPRLALGPVTIDGVKVSKGMDIARTGILRVFAGDYMLDSIRLVVDGSVWVPLDFGPDFLEFLVQSSGSFEVFAGEKSVFAFSNSVDIEYPSWMSKRVRGRISSSNTATDRGDADSEVSVLQYYLNYNVLVSEEFPYYLVAVGKKEDYDSELYQVENGSIVAIDEATTFTWIHIEPSDLSRPVILRYAEAIVFIANIS